MSEGEFDRILGDAGADRSPVVSREALEALDVDDVDMGAEFIETQTDLAHYVEVLRYSLSAWPEIWEAATLSEYLGSMAKALDQSWPGNFDEVGDEGEVRPSWRGFARLLLAASGEV